MISLSGSSWVDIVRYKEKDLTKLATIIVRMI